uniref:Uncharacterized protein n=1 Tax=Globodera pallida TaxID=36090 RepID=A0A183C3W0_GLOPA
MCTSDLTTSISELGCFVGGNANKSKQSQPVRSWSRRASAKTISNITLVPGAFDDANGALRTTTRPRHRRESIRQTNPHFIWSGDRGSR